MQYTTALGDLMYWTFQNPPSLSADSLLDDGNFLDGSMDANHRNGERSLTALDEKVLKDQSVLAHMQQSL